MANAEEASPLLQHRPDASPTLEETTPPAAPPPAVAKRPAECVANGLPLGHGTVVGEPVARNQWSSGLFSCLGRSDEFWSSDVEVCLIGSMAPCVLYGGNVERLGSGRGWFANSCFPYATLFMLGSFLFGSNCLAAWFAYDTRTAIRRKFNLEGNFEAFAKSCGCCRGILEDEEQREQMETACDFATHYCCHSCSLCQEGRELRRRLPHPGFIGKPLLVMMPPVEQTMGRAA